MAQVAEGGADLATNFFQSVGNMTASSSAWALSALSASRTWSQDAWDGVDLYGVAIQRSDGDVRADNGDLLLAWLQSDRKSAYTVVATFSALWPCRGHH